MRVSILILLLFVAVGSVKGENDVRLKAFKESIEYESIGNYQKAYDSIQKIYGQFKSNYLVNLRMGWLLYLLKQYDNSIRYYNEAVRVSNNSAEALLGLTYPLAAKEMWDEIEVIYKNILDKDEFNYTANLNLGQIYLNKKNYLNAKILLDVVLKSYPSDHDANLYLGWAYYYLGDKIKAHELFENAVIINNNSTSAIDGMNLTR